MFNLLLVVTTRSIISQSFNSLMSLEPFGDLIPGYKERKTLSLVTTNFFYVAKLPF